MTLDPISIATAGYVCGGCPDPIAIGTLGYVCAVERAVRGGDPEGAWGDRYAYFLRRGLDLLGAGGISVECCPVSRLSLCQLFIRQ